MSIAPDEIDELLNVKRRSLAFPASIELRFQEDTEGRLCRRRVVGMLVSAALYNLFLLADWLLVRDVFGTSVILHLFVVTPWMMFAAWTNTRTCRPFVREMIAASVPLLIIMQIDVTVILTASENASHYQYVVIPTIMYANVSLHRLAFPFARFVSAAIVACHSIAIVLSTSIIGPVAAMIVLQISICTYISLVANFTMERDLRRSYLFALRDSLRHSKADEAARRDALTGLSNRRHLDERVRDIWCAEGTSRNYLSVILIDVDHFKKLNDKYGHAEGDVCLKVVATVVVAELGDMADCVVRYGGEEFLALLPSVDLVDAIAKAEQVRRSIEGIGIPTIEGGMTGLVTASFGVASASVMDLTASELIAAADKALYVAKLKGRNQIWPSVPRTPDEYDLVRSG